MVSTRLVEPTESCQLQAVTEKKMLIQVVPSLDTTKKKIVICNEKNKEKRWIIISDAAMHLFWKGINDIL